MYLLLFKNFFRSRSAYLGLAFLLLSGMVSIYIGKQFIDKQENNIEHTAKYQQDHIQRYVK
jgi:ABC-2 type transport system permease protein